ncbi:MAG TPA: hypothetical protein VEI81_05715, partial [Methanoregula sp.]|nr:hypothetical protein [Methanoregula sp.]
PTGSARHRMPFLHDHSRKHFLAYAGRHSPDTAGIQRGVIPGTEYPPLLYALPHIAIPEYISLGECSAVKRKQISRLAQARFKPGSDGPEKGSEYQLPLTTTV